MTDAQTTNEAPRSDSEPTRLGPTSSRRLVLLGAGAVGATAVLTACGNGGASTNADGSDFSNDPAPAGSKGADALGGGGSGDGSNDSGGGVSLAKVADVQVGGGVITADYVVTQPEKGTFKAFTKTCPHRGCPVSKIENGEIKCTCHGSNFSIQDGSVTGGPSPKGLTEKQVSVKDGNVILG